MSKVPRKTISALEHCALIGLWYMARSRVQEAEKLEEQMGRILGFEGRNEVEQYCYDHLSDAIWGDSVTVVDMLDRLGVTVEPPEDAP